MVRLVTAYTATARQLRLPAWADPAGAPDGLGGVGEVQASHGGDLEAAELDPAAAVVAAVVGDGDGGPRAGVAACGAGLAGWP
jgi:hypothetical protein